MELYGLIGPPAIGHQLVDCLIVLQAFGRRAVAFEPSSVVGTKRLEPSVGVKGEVTGEGRLAAHVGYDAVYPWFAVETVEHLPIGSVLPKEVVVVFGHVEDEHAVVRNLTKKGLHGGTVPYITLITKHPSLQSPHGKIGRAHV